MRFMVTIDWWRVALTITALTVLSTSSAQAQACIGYAQGRGGALNATVTFPEGGTGYDLNGMVASRDYGTFLTGGFGVVAPEEEEGEDFESTKNAHAAIAYEIEALAPDASICPVIGVTYSWVEDLNTLTVPFGVGVGSTIPLGRGGSGLTPFAIPHFLYLRESIDDAEEDPESDVFVALEAGLTLNLKAFRITGGVSKIFEEELDPVYSVTVGAVWR